MLIMVLQAVSFPYIRVILGVGVKELSSIDVVPRGVSWGPIGIDGGRGVFLSVVSHDFCGFQIAYEHYSASIKVRFRAYGGGWYGWVSLI